MTKPRSNRLGMYADVREIADLALAHGGGEYECLDNGAAIHWQQRFYRFRKLHASLHHIDGTDSPYDKLVLPRVKDSIVRLQVRQHVGTFRPAGPRVALDIQTDDELFNIAASLAARINT